MRARSLAVVAAILALPALAAAQLPADRPPAGESVPAVGTVNSTAEPDESVAGPAEPPTPMRPWSPGSIMLAALLALTLVLLYIRATAHHHHGRARRRR